MFFLSIFLFIPGASFGETYPSQSKVEHLTPKKVKHSLKLIKGGKDLFERNLKEAEDSLVLVVGRDQKGQRLWGGVGWIVKDTWGTVGVMTSFRVIDRALDGKNIKQEDMKHISFDVYIRSGTSFAVEELRGIDPIENLVFLTLKGDVTQSGKRTPLKFVDAPPTETEPLFYTIRQNGLQSNKSWFEMRKVKHAISLPGRQDFLVDTDLDKIYRGSPVDSLVLNQRGEVVSFASRSAEYILFGTPLNKLKGFLSRSSENCSISFLRNCVIKARKTLYENAYKNDRAARELVSHKSEDRFAKFMRSIGISDSSRVEVEREDFLKLSIRWNPDLYYQWLVDTGNLDIWLLKYLEESIEQLAEQGHPYFQYFLALAIDGRRPHRPKEVVLRWIGESSRKGYAPALFSEGVSYLTGSVNGLKGLTAGSHASLQQLLGFLEKHLREKIVDSIREYEQTTSVLDFPPRRRLYSFFRNIQHTWREGFSGMSLPAVYVAHFSEVLDNFIKGFDLLYQSADQNYGSSQELVSDFEKHIISWKQFSDVPFSQHIEQCEQLFVKYTHP